MPEHASSNSWAAVPDNTALAAAIRAYEDGPERDRNAVLRLLLDSRLVIPMTKPPDPETNIASVACPLIDNEGNRILATFTDIEALRRMELAPGARVFKIAATSTCQMVIDNDCVGLIINPNGPARFFVPRNEAEAPARGTLPEQPEHLQVPAGTLMKIANHSERPPDAVLDELRLILELAGVETAYWCETSLDEGPLRPTILIDPHTDQITDKVMPKLEAVFSRYKPLDGRFTVWPLQRRGKLHGQDDGREDVSLKELMENEGDWFLLFKSGRQGYPRFVRSEDTMDGWHSFHPDPRLLPAPEPPSNAALAFALEDGCRNQPTDHTPVHRALFGTKLLVPVHRLPEGASCSSCLLVASRELAGNPVLVGAANEAAFRRWNAGPELWWVLLPAEQLCAMALEGRFQGVLLMSENYPGYAMNLMECEAVARGLIPSASGEVSVEQGSQIAFGLPSQRPPAAFLIGLRRAAERTGADEVYWVYMSVAKQPIHMALAIRPWARELGEILAGAINEAIVSYPEVTPYVDILDLDQQPAAREEGELLYRRTNHHGIQRMP